MEKIEFYKNQISVEKRELFSAFRSLLLEYNEKYNLTTITEEKDMFYKHFLDSAMGAYLFKENARVAEIGSGAGFPSIVLKILRPDLSFDLFESVGKKCEFLNTVCKELEFDNAKAVCGRAEELAKTEEYREKFDICTARAVARLNTLCEYTLPFVKVGGYFVAYKGDAEEELTEAKNAIKILGGQVEEINTFELEGVKRQIIVIKKIKNTPEKYPRGNGKERKKPL